MFSRFYVVFIFCCVLAWYTEGSLALGPTTASQISNYDLRISQQNTKFAKLEKYISGLETRISQQNTKFAKLEKYISGLETKIEHQNTQFSDQNTQIEHLKTNIANLNTNIANLKVEQNKELCELKSQMEKIQKPEKNNSITQSPSIGNDTGVVFTRWGRKDCPQSISTLVYSGIAGGGHFTHSGGSVNYVCMPQDPIWNENKHLNDGKIDYLYKAEYETQTKSGIFNYEVPCAVCRAAPYSSKLMIPARNKCYSGWQEAYHGQLASGHCGNKGASEYACLDQDPEIIGDNTDNGGKWFCSVLTGGTLLYPAYKSSSLLTCVVCVK